MSSPDSERFFNLPALTVSKFLEMEPGDFLKLGVLEYIETGDRDHSSGVIFPFIYTHERVEFRSPGQKDAVAFGQGCMEHDPEPRPCRILFSQYHQTASVRGLTFDGSVKALGLSGTDMKALHEIVRGPRGQKQPDETTMSDWKNTNYGAPKSWDQQQREKREKELEKVSASPVPMLLLFGTLGLVTIGCLAALLVSVLR